MVDRTQDNKPPALALDLFGPLQVRVHGTPLPRLHSRKVAWLLALLVLRHGKPLERDWLVGTLWPDSSQSQALAYLSQSLTELRRVLATEAGRLLAPTRHTLALELSGATVDLLTFDTALQQGDFTSLERAVAVYRGPLLEGCTEDWALQERASREQSYLAALQRLAEDASARGEAGIAASYLRRVVAVDALLEGAQRALMQALALEGNYTAATQVYRDLRLHLHRELNAEPDPQTTEVYNRLRAQTRQKVQSAPKAVPPLSSSPPPCRLPTPLTDLLGRDTEIPQIAARLRQRRLVTLTGAGGVGKTRLAIAVAETLVEEYADGVWFVDLAGLSDAGLVVHSVAAMLGVREKPGGSLQEELVSFLRPKLLLLVLDNCEHLLGACAQLAGDLLQACRGVRILATSRQALGITGEEDWQVPSLPVPDLAHLPAEATDLLAVVSECASVQLFVERAEAVQKAFALTTQNAISVAQICKRLDGIPLAIELAASNVKVLPADQIARRLDDAFRLLTRGSRTALPRQQTLRATLDWSYALLNDSEKTLLCGLSVFAGNWTLEAVEAIGTGAEVEERTVLGLLTSLVDKNLVAHEEQTGEVRYRLLETMRQYARERLAESGAVEIWRIAHRDYFLQMAEEAQKKLSGQEQSQWLQRLETEHDNLRAALDFCLDAPDGAQVGLRLAVALRQFWKTHGHLSEGRARLAAMLVRPEAQAPTEVRARACNGAGSLAWMQGDYAAARSLHEESLALGRVLGDKHLIASTLYNLGLVPFHQGDYAIARSLFEESLELRRELGDKWGLTEALIGLGNVALEHGDYAAARSLGEESLALARELKDKRSIARSLIDLGNVANQQGDYAAARSLYEESLIIQRELGDNRGTARSLNNLGRVAFEQGDYAAARSLYEESLALARELGDKGNIAQLLCNLGPLLGKQGEYLAAQSCLNECFTICRDLGEKRVAAYALESCAELSHWQQQAERSVRLYGAAHALRQSIDSPLPPAMREKYERNMAAVREALGEEAFSVTWAQGQAMSWEQAIEYVFSVPPLAFAI